MKPGEVFVKLCNTVIGGIPTAVQKPQRPVQKLQSISLGNPQPGYQAPGDEHNRKSPLFAQGLRKDTRKLIGPGEVTPNRWPLTPLDETGVSTCSYSHVWGIQKGVFLETTIVLVHVDSMVRVI